MGTVKSYMCCGDRAQTEAYGETILPLDSRSYRANLVHSSNKLLESIEQVNSKPVVFDEMDRINQLLDFAESRITTAQSITKLAEAVQKEQEVITKSPINVPDPANHVPHLKHISPDQMQKNIPNPKRRIKMQQSLIKLT